MRVSPPKKPGKAATMLRSPEFQVFLFALFFAVICIPFFVVFPSQQGLANMFDRKTFFAFLLLWGAVIVVLFLIARSLRHNTDKNAETKKGDGPNV